MAVSLAAMLGSRRSWLTTPLPLLLALGCGRGDPAGATDEGVTLSPTEEGIDSNVDDDVADDDESDTVGSGMITRASTTAAPQPSGAQSDSELGAT